MAKGLKIPERSRYFLRYVGLWAFCLAAFCLPFTLAYLNRASVVLWAFTCLGAVARLSRPVLKLDWAVVAFLLWGILSCIWEYQSGLAIDQSLQLVGLVLGGEWILSAGSGLTTREKSWISWSLAGGVALSIAAIFFDWQSGCSLMDPIFALRHKPSINRCWLSALKTGPIALSVLTPLLWRWRPAAAIGMGVGLCILAGIVDSHATLLALVAATITAAACRVAGVDVMRKIVAFGLGAVVLCMPLIISQLPNSQDVARLAPWLPNSARHRIVIWQFADEMISQRPLLGWGLNNARAIPGGNDAVEVWSKDAQGTVYPMMQPQMPLHPHNMALQIWLETGLIGALLGAMALGRIVMRLGRNTGAPGLASAISAFSVGLVSFGAWQAWWLASLWLFAFYGSVLNTRYDATQTYSPSRDV